jgi:hypothetical protein
MRFVRVAAAFVLAAAPALGAGCREAVTVGREPVRVLKPDAVKITIGKPAGTGADAAGEADETPSEAEN